MSLENPEFSNKKPNQILSFVKRKKRELRIVLLSWIFALALIKISNNKERHETNKIKKGLIEYTEKWWRIDWWHANPTWARDLWRQFEDPVDFNDFYFLVEYQQQSKKFWIAFNNVSQKFLVKKNISLEEMKWVALAIFISVSRSFEEAQSWHDFYSGSSYNQSDLMWNLVGFYRAVEWYSQEEVKSFLRPVWIDSSLSLYNHIWGLWKNEQRIPLVHDPESLDWVFANMPKNFSTIKTYRLGKYYEHRKWIMFFEHIVPKNLWGFRFVDYSHDWFPMFEYVQDKDSSTFTNTKKRVLWKPQNLYKKEYPKITNIRLDPKLSTKKWDTLSVTAIW